MRRWPHCRQRCQPRAGVHTKSDSCHCHLSDSKSHTNSELSRTQVARNMHTESGSMPLQQLLFTALWVTLLDSVPMLLEGRLHDCRTCACVLRTQYVHSSARVQLNIIVPASSPFRVYFTTGRLRMLLQITIPLSSLRCLRCGDGRGLRRRSSRDTRRCRRLGDNGSRRRLIGPLHTHKSRVLQHLPLGTAGLESCRCRRRHELLHRVRRDVAAVRIGVSLALPPPSV